jgi:putative hydrolase of the HAD superfamily
MPFRFILFDLDDTLIYEMASEKEAFAAACGVARKRIGLDAEALQAAVRRSARDLWRAAPTYAYCNAIGIASWEGLWGRFTGGDPNLRALREWAPFYQREAWRRALAAMGHDGAELAAELSSVYQRERRQRHVPFPDTIETLQRLRHGRKLGILTNGAPDVQREKIDAAGLSDHFDAIVISGEVAVGKPDPRVFALAVERLGATPAESVMVGDSLERDVAGARGAGIRAVWVNGSGRAQGNGAAPDATIRSLSELPDALARMERELIR